MKRKSKTKEKKDNIKYEIEVIDILNGILKGFPLKIINTNSYYKCVDIPYTIASRSISYRNLYHNGFLHGQYLYVKCNTLEDYLSIWLKCIYPKSKDSVEILIEKLANDDCINRLSFSENGINEIFYSIPFSKIYEIQGE